MPKKTKHPTLAIFDADGTVLDTMKYHRILAVKCIKKYFGEISINSDIILKKYNQTSGIPFIEQLEIIFPEKKFKEKIKPCAAEYNQRKIVEVYKKSKVFKQAINCITKLNNLQILSFISSSTEREIIYKLLKQANQCNLFKEILGVERGSKPKHIKLIRKKYNPKTIFFIGDSINDMKSNKNGVITIGRYANQTSKKELSDAGADFIMNNLQKVPKLISKYHI